MSVAVVAVAVAAAGPVAVIEAAVAFETAMPPAERKVSVPGLPQVPGPVELKVAPADGVVVVLVGGQHG